jgi:hypothetical protein
MADVNTSTAKVSPLIWVVLLLTVAFTLWTALQDDDISDTDVVVNKFDRPKRNQTMSFSQKDLPVSHQGDVVQRQDGVIDWERLDRTAEEKPKNLFRANNWAVAPKQQPRKQVAIAPPAPPPKPKAPPIPFAYMGRLNDGPQGNLIYLSSNDKSYSVPLGKKINGFWRLDSEDDNALYFTYLPLSLPQILPKNQTLAGQGSSAIPPGAFK